MTNNNPPSNKKKKNGGKRHNKRKLPGDEKFEWQKATKTLTFWALIVIVAWILFRQMNLAEQPEINKSYSQYLKLLESGQIDAAEIIDRDFHGQLNDGSTIVTTLPFINKEMITEWDSLRIDFQFKDKTTSWIGYLITSILPWIVIIGIWLYLMRRMQGGGSRGVFSFGKSKAKLMMETKLKVTFSDVAGCDEAKEELKEIIEFLKVPFCSDLRVQAKHCLHEPLLARLMFRFSRCQGLILLKCSWVWVHQGCAIYLNRVKKVLHV
jgi:cell division protease FtsH